DDARSTFFTKGLNLQAFSLVLTNSINDRLYMATPAGSLVCLREIGAVNPTPLRDPGQRAFGYIPPEGYPDAIPDAPPTTTPPPPVEPAAPPAPEPEPQ